MSISTVSTILGRIEVAEPDSPIAVFYDPTGRLDAMFANTIETQKAIESRFPPLVGIYDNSMDLKSVRGELLEILAQVAA